MHGRKQEDVAFFAAPYERPGAPPALPIYHISGRGRTLSWVGVEPVLDAAGAPLKRALTAALLDGIRILYQCPACGRVNKAVVRACTRCDTTLWTALASGSSVPLSVRTMVL